MIRTSDVDGDAAMLSVENSNVITHDDVVLNTIFFTWNQSFFFNSNYNS